MLKHEFEDRTGIKVTSEEYTKIEQMYNTASDNIDKDVFCEDWYNHRDSKLLKDFFIQLRKCEYDKEQLETEKAHCAELMLEKADKYDDNDLWNMAVSMIGISEVIKLKVQHGYSLNTEEKAYIKEYLK